MEQRRGKGGGAGTCRLKMEESPRPYQRPPRPPARRLWFRLISGLPRSRASLPSGKGQLVASEGRLHAPRGGRADSRGSRGSHFRYLCWGRVLPVRHSGTRGVGAYLRRKTDHLPGEAAQEQGTIQGPAHRAAPAGPIASISPAPSLSPAPLSSPRHNTSKWGWDSGWGRWQ